MKKINRKMSLFLILFASMFSMGLKNQDAYVTKAVEEGSYVISFGSAAGTSHGLNNAGDFEAQYASPDGISWGDDCSSVYGFDGWALHLGGLSGYGDGHMSLKLDSVDYYITKVTISASRFTVFHTKAALSVNNKNEQKVQNGEHDFHFDVAQDKTQNIVINIKEQAAYIHKIQVYYAETDFRPLIKDITAADTCTEYGKAAGFRTRYNNLTNSDRTRFNNTKITDMDENGNIVELSVLEKLEYMEYLASLNSSTLNAQSQSITQQIAEKKSIGWILMIGTMILSVSVYGIIAKRKWKKQ